RRLRPAAQVDDLDVIARLVHRAERLLEIAQPIAIEAERGRRAIELGALFGRDDAVFDRVREELAVGRFELSEPQVSLDFALFECGSVLKGVPARGASGDGTGTGAVRHDVSLAWATNRFGSWYVSSKVARSVLLVAAVCVGLVVACRSGSRGQGPV